MAKSIFILKAESENLLARIASVTGILSGGLITANVTNPTTQYDVGVGTILNVDFTDPTNPVATVVPFGPFIGEDPLNLSTTSFTVNAIDSGGDLVKSNTAQTPQERRQLARLQLVQHATGTITGFSKGQTPAYNVSQAILDYVAILGSLNTGNAFVAAASANLRVSKSSGVTSLPFINFTNDPDDPNNLSNPEQDPANLVQIFQNSTAPGGFDISAVTDVPVGFWDDGSDTLQATTQWVNYYFYFFNDISVVVVGQAIFAQESQAEAARFPEPNRPAELFSSSLRTILTVKGNVTDLLNDADVAFFQVAGAIGGGPSAVASVFGRTGVVNAAASDYDADEVDYDNTTSGLTAVEVQAAIDEVAAGVTTLATQTTAGSTLTIDLSAKTHIITLADNITTVTIIDPLNAGDFSLKFVQSGAGAFTVSGWSANVFWPGGTPPTFGDATGTRRLVRLEYDGPSSDEYLGDFDASVYS